MILDSEGLFSDAQDLAGISAATASTNYIDMTATERQVGTGEPVKIFANVDTAMTASAITITIKVEVDDNTSFSSAKTLATFPVFSGAAGVPAGTIKYVTLPGGAEATERYMRLTYTPSAGLTTGAFTAGIIHDEDGQRQLPSGFAISGS
jgi:hypothetical protein